VKTTYTHEELQKMIEECESSVENLVKSETEALKKREHGKDMAKSATSAAEGSAEKKEASASGPSGTPKTTDAANGGLHKGADDPADGAASPSPDALPSEGDANASADPAASAAPADPAAPAPGAEQAPTPEMLVEAYSQLSPEELQMHMVAMQQVMQSQSAGAGAPPASPAAPPADPMAAPAASPAPDASAAPAPMPGADSQPVAPAFAKSEAGLKIATLEKNLELTTQALQVLLAKPSFKSVDALDTVVKSEVALESLSKGEITERLNKAVRSSAFTQGDSAMLKKYFQGTAGVRDIAHLLATK